jgi:hypothetical protein
MSIPLMFRLVGWAMIASLSLGIAGAAVVAQAMVAVGVDE